MSLVSEALRKARQRGDGGHPPGAVVPPSLVLPPRRYRSGIGLAPLLLIAVTAGFGGAAGVWWAVGRQRPAPAPATAATPPRAAEPLVVAPADTGKPAALASAPGESPAPAASVPAPAEAAGSVPRPATDPAAAPIADSAPAAPHAGAELATPGQRRTRDVLIDADLGYAKLHLDYLVYRRGSPFGRVNGHDVIVGSIVEGFAVVEITAEYIKLSDRRNVVILRVR